MTQPTSPEYVAEVREQGLNDLFFFTRAILGMDRLTDRFHKEMCHETQEVDALRRLWLVPRDHFKSTIMAIAFPIWLLVRNPEERILLVGDTATRATKKLAKIQSLILESKGIRAFFPEIIPDNIRKTKWSESEITIPREEAHAEASVTAAGVGVAVVGAHFTRIILDDIATYEAAHSAVVMQAAKDWVDGVEDLLVEPYRDTIDVIGTRWSHSDVYEHIQEKWGEAGEREYDGRPFFRSFVRSFWEREGVPLFPELYGGADNALDFARRRRKENPYLWSCNYENDPRAPEAEFDLEDLRYYKWDKDYEHIYFDEGEHKRPTVISLATLDIYITVDPAWSKKRGASAAAIIVSGAHHSGAIFCLETRKGHWGGQGVIREVIAVVKKYRPYLRALGCEATGTQISFIEDLQKELRRKDLYVRVEDLRPGTIKDKDARIRFHLQPVIASGRFFILSEQTALAKELRHFPLSEDKDLLDAAAYAAEYYWKRPITVRDEDETEEAMIKARLATRSARTGY